MRKIIFVSVTLIALIFSYSFLMTYHNNGSLPYRVAFNNLAPTAKQEVECLAENIYFESAYEPTDGKVAVAFVTLNRVNSGKFADSICGVVKQKIKNVCQFSWWCETKPYYISVNKVLTNSDNMLYNEIRNLATHVYINYEKMKDPSKGALFYHADYVNPKWRNMETTIKIGRHIFYKKV